MVKDLYYDDLVESATIGGYAITTRLSNLTALFLLSACTTLRDKYLWQTPLIKISDAEYQNIIAMIEQAEYELMTSFAIGQIISSVADLSGNDNLLVMDGTIVDGTQYPELLDAVPASWVSGTDITLPEMTKTGVFGENGDIGDIVGENSVQLQISEMPSHTHIQNSHTHTYNQPVITPTAAGLEPALADIVVATPSLTSGTIATNQNTGGNGSHNNVQQSLSVYWYIVAR